VSGPDQARDAIESGLVVVAGAPATTPHRLVASGEPIRILGPPPRFVGRGGEKLEAALAHFGIDVAGRRALDAGASTGGFTDCLLQRGATSVVALDVGRNQLHERLRVDRRVEHRERTDVRDVAPEELESFSLVVADLSFISLRSVTGPLLQRATPDADLVLLVKPQFEATQREAARGKGVITDPAIWRRVIADVIGGIVARGAAIMGAMASPVRGADGNVEFFLHARPSDGAGMLRSRSEPIDLDVLVGSVGAGAGRFGAG